MRIRFSAWVLCAFPLIAGAQPGAWEPQGNAGYADRACIQQWICSPPKTMRFRADDKIVATPARSVREACITSGPADTCTACASAPPTERCEWYLEPY